MHTRTIPPQFDSPLFAPKRYFSPPLQPISPLLLFAPSLSTFLKFPQVKWQLTSRPLWSYKRLLSHRRPPSVSHFALSCPFFLSSLLSFSPSLFLFSFHCVIFPHSKHSKWFNRQAVLNQPTNQLIWLFVTLPLVFFCCCFYLNMGLFHSPSLRPPHMKNTQTCSIKTSQADERDGL